MRYYFTPVSRNAKTGPMPVVTASKDSCPTSCLLLNNGCYAQHGKLGLFWSRMSSGEFPTLSFPELIDRIRALPRKQIWRYGQAGDLPDEPERILELAAANRGRPVIVYTHKRDVEIYRAALVKGLVVNLSANTLEEADSLAATGLPVTVVLPSFYRRGEGEDLREYRARLGGSLSLATPGGNKVAICPEVYLETNCLACQACSKVRPGGTIIGFPAHGARKGAIDKNIATEGRPIPWSNHNEFRRRRQDPRVIFSHLSPTSPKTSPSKSSASSQSRTTNISATP